MNDRGDTQKHQAEPTAELCGTAIRVFRESRPYSRHRQPGFGVSRHDAAVVVTRDSSRVLGSGGPRWYPGPYREMNLALQAAAGRAGTRGRTAR